MTTEERNPKTYGILWGIVWILLLSVMQLGDRIKRLEETVNPVQESLVEPTNRSSTVRPITQTNPTESVSNPTRMVP